jgi:thioredoxin reductase
MGLIRNAIEQGRQAIDSIEKKVSTKHSNELDLVIVGAGPAGIAATLGARAKKLKSATIEQDSLGGTVAHFPRRKLVMTQPAELPIVGKMKFKEVSKETLIDFWAEVEKKVGLKIRYGERVDAIEPLPGGGFRVKTTANQYNTRTVLLSIGRRGTPRTLRVPGEELPKVVYRLIDPEQYRNMHVLVVGGGDSALEAATSISDEPGTTVTLSYRSAAFNRAKQKNRERAETAAKNGRLTILFNSNVVSISEDSVTIAIDDREVELPNDGIIVSAGGILPTAFLQKAGIKVVTKWGTE